MTSITVTLTLEELMELPGAAVILILDKCGPSTEILQAARDYETRPLHGKARWLVLTYLTACLSEAASSV